MKVTVSMKATVSKDASVYRIFQPAVKVFTRFQNGRGEVVVVAGGHRYAFDLEYYTVECEGTSRED